MSVGFKVTRLYFDRAEVIAAMDAKTLRSLSKAGAYISRRAKTSMRPGGKSNITAKPGEPPRWHKKRLRNGIDFAWDTATKSLVVGPDKYKQGIVPRLMEEGGTSRIPGSWRRRSVQYFPHPYIGPALQKEVLAGNVVLPFAGPLETS